MGKLPSEAFFICMHLLFSIIMKVKHAIILFVLGYCLDFVGALFKIVHHPNSNIVLTAAVTLKVLGALLFLYKITTYPKIKEFMNS